MKKSAWVAIFGLVVLSACNKTTPTGGASTSTSPPSTSSDPVQQKLQSSAGNGAMDCGRMDIKASADQLRAASDCALQSSQGKKPFYVAYIMPGMSVGVAGNAEGKLFTVQSQGDGPTAALTSGDCPSQLRVASSGRVTCFAPGDMGSMSGSHAAGAMPGMPNPHAAANPHGSTTGKVPSKP
ncbi:MAG TPA: hypothetical protein VMH04_21740 [Candidatus Solibacter sp.]|nr:hypothetical protein [Candidatus Solibacter sp.]